MPHRYQGHKLPAMLYAQPFEFGVALILFLTGTAMLLDEKYTPASIARLEWPWSLLFQFLILAAGVLMFAGMARGKHRWSFTAELVGLVMATTIFLTYAAGLFSSHNPAAALSFCTNLVVAGCCAIRARALWIEAHNRLLLIQELPMPSKKPSTTDTGGN